MKRIVILIFYCVFFFSCSTVNGIKVKYDDKKTFNKKDLKSISDYYFSDNEKPTHLFINEIIVDDKKKVGLYEFIYKKLTNSTNLVHKILKFEDSFYIYLDLNSFNLFSF